MQAVSRLPQTLLFSEAVVCVQEEFFLCLNLSDLAGEGS